jgi:hypothetical protein
MAVSWFWLKLVLLRNFVVRGLSLQKRLAATVVVVF